MRKLGFLILASCLGALLLADQFGAVADAQTLRASYLQPPEGAVLAGFLNLDFGCRRTEGGGFTCGIFPRNRNEGNQPNRGGSTNRGERSCPPGYVVLEKANKYGAFCEPKEGLPAQAPQQAQKCQFPGQVGTPPNCQCPADTQFYGYQGCMKTCCGTPSSDPKYKQVYMQCDKEPAKAQQLAIALAKANGDPGNRVTCEATRNYPPQ
jgi:hypothetical protein